jgi:thiol-disulfide isomerase/thioredoxin
MKSLLLYIVLLIVFHTLGTGQDKSSNNHRTGEIIIDSLNSYNDTKDWFTSGYQKYKVKKRVTHQLKKQQNQKLKEVYILIFAGSWCSDTKDLLPKSMKVFDKIGLDKNQIKIIFVDRKKSAFGFDNLIMQYQITNVPTYLFFENKSTMKLIGSIIESVPSSFEKSLKKVLEVN